MKNMTIANVVKAVSGQLHLAQDVINKSGKYDEKAEATDVVIDSRKATPGCIFVATRGERVDGHSFINQVFEKGAMAVICEEIPQELSGPCILVKDSFVAIKELAAFYRDQLDIKIVGIVGSVGKTSTKELVASVLSSKFRVHKTEGNFNNEIGVPLTIFGIRENHEIAVVEMGISDFGEMNRLGTIVKPDCVVMTNIGPCHLENLGNLDGVLKAKSEVFDHVKKGGTLILNKQDPRLGAITQEDAKGLNRIFYGEGGSVFATNPISFGLEGTSFMLNLPSIKIPVKVPLPGKHMVDNAVAAAAVGEVFNLTAEQLQSGIASVQAIGGRSKLIHTEDYLVVDDCYNANPKSMMAAVNLMMDSKGRKVMILGDMFELGEDSDEHHAEVGRYAASHDIDVLICVGKNSKHMFDAAVETKDREGTSVNVFYFASKEELIGKLTAGGEDSLLKRGDTVLIKASHGMGFAEVVELLGKGH